MNDIKYCTIAQIQKPKTVALSDHLMLSTSVDKVQDILGRIRYTALKNKLWTDYYKITFMFLDGEDYVKDKCADIMLEWEDYIGLTFEEVSDQRDAYIRISFKYDGSWSYVGTDCLEAFWKEPTMNFGWLNRRSPHKEYQRVVLHEVGHALGLVHEHQNPSVDIPWNKEAVYQTYSGPPNNWSRKDIDHNLFAVYDHTTTNYSEFDPESIMLYPVPNELTHGDYEVKWNSSLSKMDIEWAKTTYPKGTHLQEFRLI